MPNDQRPNPLARIAETYSLKHLVSPDRQVRCARLQHASMQVAAWADEHAAQQRTTLERAPWTREDWARHQAQGPRAGGA